MYACSDLRTMSTMEYRWVVLRSCGRYACRSSSFYGTLVCVGVSVIMADTEAAFLSVSWQGEGTQPKAKARCLVLGISNISQEQQKQQYHTWVKEPSQRQRRDVLSFASCQRQRRDAFPWFIMIGWKNPAEDKGAMPCLLYHAKGKGAMPFLGKKSANYPLTPGARRASWPEAGASAKVKVRCLSLVYHAWVTEPS